MEVPHQLGVSDSLRVNFYKLLWIEVKCRPDVKNIGEGKLCSIYWKKREIDGCTSWMKREGLLYKWGGKGKTTHMEYVKQEFCSKIHMSKIMCKCRKKRPHVWTNVHMQCDEVPMFELSHILCHGQANGFHYKGVLSTLHFH